jgi:hypothetical protein
MGPGNPPELVWRFHRTGRRSETADQHQTTVTQGFKGILQHDRDRLTASP